MSFLYPLFFYDPCMHGIMLQIKVKTLEIKILDLFCNPDSYFLVSQLCRIFLKSFKNQYPLDCAIRPSSALDIHLGKNMLESIRTVHSFQFHGVVSLQRSLVPKIVMPALGQVKFVRVCGHKGKLILTSLQEILLHGFDKQKATLK